MDQQTIDYLKSTYPEVITKDQFYRICHVSKRTATYLLDNGFVPCTNSGKKTRKYKMRFLKLREANPLSYKAPENYYKDNKGKNFSYAYALNTNRLMRYRKMLRVFLENHLANCDDVLTPIDIEGILGYSYKSVTRWCINKELRAFLMTRALLDKLDRVVIPKDICKVLRLTPGSPVIFSVENGKVVITPEEYYDHFDAMLKEHSEILDEILEKGLRDQRKRFENE